MIKNVKISQLVLITTIIAATTGIISPAIAILGNTIEQNSNLFKVYGHTQKYNFKGSKDSIIYNKDNATITVFYRNNKSILEDITFSTPVSQEEADSQIKKLILPTTDSKPQYTSSMAYADGYFKEDLYKNGLKTKTIYNDNGLITEIIASVRLSEEAYKKYGQ